MPPPSALPLKEPLPWNVGAGGGAALASGLQASRLSRAEETTAAHWRTLLTGWKRS